jgi:toxin ParE1/3/4
MSFYLTNKAKSDLKNIAKYTQEVWGKDQRNIYLDNIDAVFHRISEPSHKGKSCDYIRSGYCKYHIQKHIIFYRKINKSEVQITRILHEKMDFSDHLSHRFSLN